MTLPPTEGPPVLGHFRTPLLLALCGAGLAGNYLNFPLFLNIDVLFGSVFAMLALQFFGLARGTLAAAVIASYSCLLWNHPYAMVTMTAEVAAVGLLLRRHRIDLVLADTLFWLLIGIPLVWVFYHLVMQVPLNGTCLLFAKQAVNGIANALIARIIFIKYLLYSRSGRISYHDVVYTLLVSFVLFPALVLLSISGKADFAATDRQIRAQLLEEGNRLDSRLASNSS